jgi:hypothetical protein
MKPDKQLLEAWRNGVRLRDAWWQFADPQTQKDFVSLKSEEIHFESEHNLKAELIERLYSGELRAIGFESKTGKQPSYIAANHFLSAAEIGWEKDTVTSLGEEYFDIVVQSSGQQLVVEFPPEAQVVDSRLPRVRGRPSKEPEINRAIDKLLEKGFELAKISRADARAAIIKCAKELDPDTNIDIGFSDEVFQRILFGRFGRRR